MPKNEMPGAKCRWGAPRPCLLPLSLAPLPARVGTTKGRAPPARTGAHLVTLAVLATVLSAYSGASSPQGRAPAQPIAFPHPRHVKDLGMKGIQSQTQGEQLRVIGKKRDSLQEVIAALRDEDFGIPLQFENFRD